MQDFRCKLLASSCEPRAFQVLIEINGATIVVEKFNCKQVLHDLHSAT